MLLQTAARAIVMEFAGGNGIPIPGPSSFIAALSGVVLFSLIGLVRYRRRTQAMLTTKKLG